MSERSERSSMESKSQTEEHKDRSDDLKPHPGKGQQQVESEEDDSEPEPQDEKAIEASLPQRTKPGQASGEEDDNGESFQDVQL